MYMFLAYGCLYNSKHMKPKEEYSWNDCCLLSGSVQIAPHILKTEITFTTICESKRKKNYNVELG